MKNWLILLATACLFQTANAQEKQHFSVFVMDGIETMDECRSIQQDFRQIQGVVMARADVHTKRFFIIYTDDANLSEKAFRDAFNEKGYEVKCYHEGIQGRDEMTPVSEESCDE